MNDLPLHESAFSDASLITLFRDRLTLFAHLLFVLFPPSVFLILSEILKRFVILFLVIPDTVLRDSTAVLFERKHLVDAFIHLGGSIYSMGGPSENQTLKWCRVGVGLNSSSRGSPKYRSNPPFYEQQHRHLEGGENRDRSCPEKAAGQ